MSAPLPGVDAETWRLLTEQPPITPDEPKAKDKEVRDAKKALHSALTLGLNKIVCPIILRACWNYVAKDRPLTYGETAALCLGAATLKSFVTFSSGM